MFSEILADAVFGCGIFLTTRTLSSSKSLPLISIGEVVKLRVFAFYHISVATKDATFHLSECIAFSREKYLFQLIFWTANFISDGIFWLTWNMDERFLDCW